GAAAALLGAGAPGIVIVNRSRDRAEALAGLLGTRVSVTPWAAAADHVAGVQLVINAIPAGVGEGGGLDLAAARRRTVVMDMVYRPPRTPLLAAAEALGLTTVDGLAMLIGQAVPSFAALFGRAPPSLDVRALALRALGDGA
ncbi:MAG: shikimate dehydrogenase, partial [Caulobacteraceae bacterium]